MQAGDNRPFLPERGGTPDEGEKTMRLLADLVFCGSGAFSYFGLSIPADVIPSCSFPGGAGTDTMQIIQGQKKKDNRGGIVLRRNGAGVRFSA